MLAQPGPERISRRIETRADVDALRATDDPEAFIEMQRQLALRSLADLTPPAWSQFWFGSHPTTRASESRWPRWLSDQVAALASAVVAEVLTDRSHVSVKSVETPSPRAKTATTMTAAMPAISRPYSTAEAPRSAFWRGE